MPRLRRWQLSAHPSPRTMLSRPTDAPSAGYIRRDEDRGNKPPMLVFTISRRTEERRVTLCFTEHFVFKRIISASVGNKQNVARFFVDLCLSLSLPANLALICAFTRRRRYLPSWAFFAVETVSFQRRGNVLSLSKRPASLKVDNQQLLESYQQDFSENASNQHSCRVVSGFCLRACGGVLLLVASRFPRWMPPHQGVSQNCVLPSSHDGKYQHYVGFFATVEAKWCKFRCCDPICCSICRMSLNGSSFRTVWAQ